MAILRSISGEFYEVPDKQLDNFLIPEDKVKEKLDKANIPSGAAEGPPPVAFSGAPVVVQYLTPAPGMGYCAPPSPGPEAAGVNPYGIHVDWGGGHHGGHHGGHWGGGHWGGGHWGHPGGHWGGHWGGYPGWGHGGHWGGGHCW